MSSASPEPGTAVAERGPIDLDRVSQPVRAMLSRLDVTATAGTAGAQLDIMSRIIEATSEEEIFEAANAGTISGQRVAGRPFLLIDFEWKRSSPGFVAQGAFPFYALCQVQFLDDGSRAVLDCGGFTFVSVLDALDRNGHLTDGHPNGYPMVLESRQMQSGFAVLIPHRAQLPAPKEPAKK